MSTSSTNSENRPPDDSAWTPCPGGEVSGMVRKVQRAKNSRQMLAGTGLGMFMLCLTAGGVYSTGLLSGDRGADYGGIYCSEVIANGQDWIAGTLPAAMVEKMNLHIAKCERCRDHLDEMRTESVSEQDRSSSPRRVRGNQLIWTVADLSHGRVQSNQ